MKFKKALSLVILFGSLLTFNSFADVSQHFKAIRKDPEKLYNFLRAMPKGGELHYHFTGSSEPQELIKAAQEDSLYIDPASFNIYNDNKLSQISTKNFFQDLKNHSDAVHAWSMQNFNGSNKERHEHFFNVFMKVNHIYTRHYPELFALQLTQAAEQNVMYMEMALLYLENPSKYHKIISDKTSLKAKQLALLASHEFQHDVKQLVAKGDKFLVDGYKYLGCDAANTKVKACQVVVRLQAYVLREATMDDFFPSALAAFIAAQKSKNIVAVNIVQPENGKLALQNFHSQMRVFNFLHQHYPSVNITLHAGELDPTRTERQYLSNHIHQSIFFGKAQRIGHGTDIRYEKSGQTTLAYMARHNIPVEINLTSNELILNVKGATQPLNYYLQHNVPVVLSTDDKGILQTDLTKQYVTAVKTYKLDYQTLKTINRNALTYSFISGKSIWQKPQIGKPVAECQDLNSQTCCLYIANNQKALLQWLLEKRLTEFEQIVASNQHVV